VKYLDRYLARVHADGEIGRVDPTEMLTAIPAKPTKPHLDQPVRRVSTLDKVPTKPTEPPSVSSDESFVGFASSHLESGPSISPSDPVSAYPWRIPLPSWPIPWREAWGRRANELEEVQGLPWRQAEWLAFDEVSRLRWSGRLTADAAVVEILSELRKYHALIGSGGFRTTPCDNHGDGGGVAGTHARLLGPTLV
jgi:hypothetical protein